MNRPDPVLQAEELLADSRWITRIARSLVADPATADDVVQDAWIAALRAPALPVDPDGSSRPWLARVVRNLAAKRLRGETRRSAREHASARGEELPSTAQLVERAEMQRHVVEAVLALAEPYRTTILLAHIEGRTSADIAERQGISDNTVRWRIQRGLALLRADLEKRRGCEWLSSCALILPLAERAPILAALKIAAPGAALATAKSAIVAGVVLACGAVAWRVESRWHEVASDVAPEVASTPNEKPDAVAPSFATDAPREESVALVSKLFDDEPSRTDGTLTRTGEQVSAALESALGDPERAREVLEKVDRALAQLGPKRPVGIGVSVAMIQAGIGSFPLDDLPNGASMFVLGEPHVVIRKLDARPRPSLDLR
jgi:RNA polymerase sigma-70 factor (ECF subfamily)